MLQASHSCFNYDAMDNWSTKEIHSKLNVIESSDNNSMFQDSQLVNAIHMPSLFMNFGGLIILLTLENNKNVVAKLIILTIHSIKLLMRATQIQACHYHQYKVYRVLCMVLKFHAMLITLIGNYVVH